MAQRKKYDVHEDVKERKKNDLPLGMVKALNHRLKADATEEQKAVANFAMQRVADVAMGKVSFRQAPSVLKAAIHIREEICGPMPKELNVNGKLTLEDLLARVEGGTEE